MISSISPSYSYPSSQMPSAEVARPDVTKDKNSDPAEGERRSVRATEESSVNQRLTEQELKQVDDLKARDREVRAHEAAHKAVGGQYAGAISYTYQRGPDGVQYAVGGEVPIDISPVAGDPQATIEKMRVVKAAAMAPAEPSAQDRAVAAEASQIMIQAKAELAAEQGKADEEPQRDSSLSEQVAADPVGARASEAYRSVAAMAPDAWNSEPLFGSIRA